MNFNSTALENEANKLLKRESRSYKAGRKDGTITGNETVDIAD